MCLLLTCWLVHWLVESLLQADAKGASRLSVCDAKRSPLDELGVLLFHTVGWGRVDQWGDDPLHSTRLGIMKAHISSKWQRIAGAVNRTSSPPLTGETTVSWLFNDHLHQRNESSSHSPTYSRSYIEERAGAGMLPCCHSVWVSFAGPMSGQYGCWGLSLMYGGWAESGAAVSYTPEELWLMKAGHLDICFWWEEETGKGREISGKQRGLRTFSCI